MTTEMARVDRLVPAQQPPELPPLLTTAERREAFRLETVRVDGTAVSKRVFIPPSVAERGQLEQIQAALEARMVPCRRETVAVQLLRMAEHFPQHKDRKNEQWTAVTVDWLRDLAEFGDGEVRQAFDDHLRDEEWFPKIAEIRKRCLELQELDRIRLRRVKMLLTGDEPRNAAPRERVDEEPARPLPTAAEILARYGKAMPETAAPLPDTSPIATTRPSTPESAAELRDSLAKKVTA